MQPAFNMFYKTCNDHLDQFYPVKRVRITNRDPGFVTPEIKLLLIEKNKLMKRGKFEAAKCVAAKIGLKITSQNSRLFSAQPIKNTAELWDRVRGVLGKNKKIAAETPGVTASLLNQHYAEISTDSNYSASPLKSTAHERVNCFDEIAVFNMLDKLKSTSEDLDLHGF